MKITLLPAAIALALTLSGCGAAEPEPSDVATTQTQDPTPTPTPKETESSDSGPVACSVDLEGAITATIESQTGAFAADDFELAYSFASPSFRATVSLEQFVQIINGSYGPLIESSSLVFSDCFSDVEEQIGVINVRFIQANNEVYGLQYLVLNTDDGWRVQGASNLAVVGEGS